MTTAKTMATLTATAVLMFATAPPARAQAASQWGSLTQKIGDHTLAIEYSRPIVRGRTIFGDHLGWGYLWTPGANDATTFEIDTDVTVNGNDVPAGKYSVWMVLAESDPWEVILEPNDSLWHTQKPEPDGEGQIRFLVEPAQGAHQEVLTFAVPDLGPNHALVELSWENIRLPLRVEVPVDYQVTVDPEKSAVFEGTYEVRWTEEILEERGWPDRVSTVEIFLEDDRLLMDMGWGPPYGQILLPLGGGIFNTGTTINGVMAGAQVESFVEFTYDGDEVTGFQIRNGEDRLMRVGTRVEGG